MFEGSGLYHIISVFSTWKVKSLPEFGSLTSIKYFGECFFRLLDKEAFCRVLNKKPLVKERESGSEWTVSGLYVRAFIILSCIVLVLP